MIQIRTTPNLFGITLLGDYQDLNALYDSLSRYLDFYMDQMGEGYPYHEYEYLLSLNYDIRHAYMGTRECELMENNAENMGVFNESMYELPEEIKKENRTIRRSLKKGNLYFSVEILYPLVFHYLIAFENILTDEPEPECFEDLSDADEPWMKDYTYFDAMRDHAQIRHFTSLLWKNVQELVGNEPALYLYDYYEGTDYMIPLSLYCDTLLHCQLRNFPNLTREEKLQFLELSLYEIIDTDDLETYSDIYEESFARYKELIKNLNKKEEFPLFPEKELFYDQLDAAFPNGKPLYEDSFDAFLDRHYGIVENDYPDW